MKPLFIDHGSAIATGSHLRVSGLSKSFPDRRVLTDVSFTVCSGERLCLVGENGSGKTTLLRIIAGLDDDHLGAADYPGSVGLYHQEPPFSTHWTVEQVMADAAQLQRQAVADISRTAERLARDPDSERAASAYDRALEDAERTGAWDIDARIEQILHGLGLAGISPARTGLELSGGQLARLSLAWLLLAQPTTLLLDEPTNHLDDRGTATLAGMISKWRGPGLVASHDRAFLEDIATGIIDLDPAPTIHADSPQDESPGTGIGITSYTGTFTDYIDAKKASRERWEKQYRDEQEQLKRMRSSMRDSHTVGHAAWRPRTEVRMAQKFYADRNAKTVSRRVRDAEQRLKDLEQNQVRKPPAELEFMMMTPDGHSSQQTTAKSSAEDTANPPRRRAHTLLAGMRLSMPGRLNPIDLSIDPRSRLLITGENGSGKTTLLSIITGTLKNYGGSLHHPPSTTIDILNQDVGAVLDRYIGIGEWAHLTAAGAYAAAIGETTAETIPLASHGLIAGRDMNRTTAKLSTGQQRRLELAIILARRPDILILDEPTNHFSLPLATALEHAIPAYPGAVIIASHDRWLRRHWTGEQITLTAPTRQGNRHHTRNDGQL